MDRHMCLSLAYKSWLELSEPIPIELSSRLKAVESYGIDNHWSFFVTLRLVPTIFETCLPAKEEQRKSLFPLRYENELV